MKNAKVSSSHLIINYTLQGDFRKTVDFFISL